MNKLISTLLYIISLIWVLFCFIYSIKALGTIINGVSANGFPEGKYMLEYVFTPLMIGLGGILFGCIGLALAALLDTSDGSQKEVVNKI